MDTNPEQAAVPAQPQKRGRGAALMIGALVLLMVGAGAAYLLTRPKSEAPEVAPPVQVATPPSTTTTAEPKTAPVEGSEPTLRQWAAKLALPSIFSPFLEGGDLARRIVSSLWTISEGEVPRPLLAFLRPEGEFAVQTRKDGTTVIAQESYARYDAVANAFGQIDMKTAAQAWTALEPVFETVHREIAPPGRTVRQTLDGAIGQLLSVQVPAEEVQVIPAEGVLYAYQDPSLEALHPAQKQLLRMGPANARTIQSKLKDFQRALGPATK